MDYPYASGRTEMGTGTHDLTIRVPVKALPEAQGDVLPAPK